MDTGGIAAERLYDFILRIEHLQEELDAGNDAKGDLYKEAKATGFDTNVMKATIKRRRNGKGATEEADHILALYEEAVENEEAKRGGPGPARASARPRPRPRPPTSPRERAGEDATTH